uniref:Uncharacterized protein n=1 Tax=Rhizophora mucronata TaxID=61149 RepID=A0A2P2KYE6_RHIMU
MHSVGVKAYRFSISWTRILPSMFMFFLPCENRILCLQSATGLPAIC